MSSWYVLEDDDLKKDIENSNSFVFFLLLLSSMM